MLWKKCFLCEIKYDKTSQFLWFSDSCYTGKWRMLVLAWLCYQQGKWQDSMALASIQSSTLPVCVEQQDNERNQTPVAEKVNASWLLRAEVISKHTMSGTAVSLRLTWKTSSFHLSSYFSSWEEGKGLIIVALQYW